MSYFLPVTTMDPEAKNPEIPYFTPGRTEDPPWISYFTPIDSPYTDEDEDKGENTASKDEYLTGF